MSGPGRDQRTGLPLVDQALADLRSQFAPLLLGLFFGGGVLTKVSLSAGTNKIPHKLRRAPRAWWVVRARDSFPVVHELTVQTNADFLVLDAATDCVVDLWVV